MSFRPQSPKKGGTDLSHCNIILIRHGITDYNRTGRLQGQIDIPLSDQGRQQAEKLAQKLKNKRIKALYSSDLSRARETAAIISRGIGLEIKDYRSDLREINFGTWERLTISELEETYPQQLAQWRADRSYSAPHGGETFAQLAARGWQAIREIAAQHPGQTVAVVAHGALIKGILCMAHGIGFQRRSRFTIDNASATTIKVVG